MGKRTIETVMKLRRVSMLPVVLVFLILVPSAWGQEAALSGTVRDSSGAVIAGAAVKITNQAQGTVRTARTNEAGVYQFSFLPPGKYGN